MTTPTTQKSRPRGKVYLVGAGPGDPELLTLKAHRLLREADLVLHDDLVSAAVIGLAGPRAIVVNVGKRCGVKKITQSEINALMVDGAREGKQVVRLKSGDPGVFGRLNEELDALNSAQISFEIVPGITTAHAAAASLGVSLTDRHKSARVIFVSGHQAGSKGPAAEPDWNSLAQENATIAVYMPGTGLRHLSKKLIAAGLSPDVSAVVVARVSSPQQKKIWTTVGALGDVDSAASPSIVLIGRALDAAAARDAIANLPLDEVFQSVSLSPNQRSIAS
ncbi:MAG TPA: uroporphyrinogen-III C-methyltransferase [Candidatus Acidoferrales bacterium]